MIESNETDDLNQPQRERGMKTQGISGAWRRVIAALASSEARETVGLVLSAAIR
jgi:hypothetical protein